MRYWPDGTVPTATAGHRLGVGDILELQTRDALQDIQFISEGTDGTLMCSSGNRK